MKLKLKKGDTVLVVSGKDKGKQGKVLKVYPTTGKLVVDGVGVHKRHTRPINGQTGRIIEKSLPVDASNVMLLDPKSGKPTRVGRSKENGARIAKKSGTTLA